MSSRETVRSTMVLVSVFSIRGLAEHLRNVLWIPRLIYLNAVNGAASQIGQGAERRDDNTVLSAKSVGYRVVRPPSRSRAARIHK